MKVAALADLSLESVVLIDWLASKGNRVVAIGPVHAGKALTVHRDKWESVAQIQPPAKWGLVPHHPESRLLHFLDVARFELVEAAAVAPRLDVPFAKSLTEAARRITSAAGSGISWWVPFAGLATVDIVRLGSAIGAPMRFGMSCTAPLVFPTNNHRAPIHCGTCDGCVDRRQAFMAAFANDDTQYAVKPVTSAAAVEKLAATPKRLPVWPIH